MKNYILLILLTAVLSACSPSRPAMVSEKLLMPLSSEERAELENSEQKVLPYLDLKENLISEQKKTTSQKANATAVRDEADNKLSTQRDIYNAAKIAAQNVKPEEVAEKIKLEEKAKVLQGVIPSLEEASALAQLQLNQATAKDEVKLAEIALNKSEMALRIGQNQELAAKLASKYQPKGEDQKGLIDLKAYEAYRVSLEKSLAKSKRNLAARNKELAYTNQKLQLSQPTQPAPASDPSPTATATEQDAAAMPTTQNSSVTEAK